MGHDVGAAWYGAALNKLNAMKRKGAEPCPMVGSNGKHAWNINGVECSCGAIYDYELQQSRRQFEEPRSGDEATAEQ